MIPSTYSNFVKSVQVDIHCVQAYSAAGQSTPDFPVVVHCIVHAMMVDFATALAGCYSYVK